MRAAFDRVDVVDVGVYVLGEFAGILQGDFDADAVLLAGHVDDVGMAGSLARFRCSMNSMMPRS